jgi:hypothetical protein
LGRGMLVPCTARVSPVKMPTAPMIVSAGIRVPMARAHNPMMITPRDRICRLWSESGCSRRRNTVVSLGSAAQHRGHDCGGHWYGDDDAAPAAAWSGGQRTRWCGLHQDPAPTPAVRAWSGPPVAAPVLLFHLAAAGASAARFRRHA